MHVRSQNGAMHSAIPPGGVLRAVVQKQADHDKSDGPITHGLCGECTAVHITSTPRLGTEDPASATLAASKDSDARALSKRLRLPGPAVREGASMWLTVFASRDFVHMMMVSALVETTSVLSLSRTCKPLHSLCNDPSLTIKWKTPRPPCIAVLATPTPHTPSYIPTSPTYSPTSPMYSTSLP